MAIRRFVSPTSEPRHPHVCERRRLPLLVHVVVRGFRNVPPLWVNEAEHHRRLRRPERHLLLIAGAELERPKLHEPHDQVPRLVLKIAHPALVAGSADPLDANLQSSRSVVAHDDVARCVDLPKVALPPTLDYPFRPRVLDRQSRFGLAEDASTSHTADPSQKAR